MDQRTYPPADGLQEFIARCKSLGVNQSEIARRAKLSAAAVSQIFTGKRRFAEPGRSKMWTALIDYMTEMGDKAIKFARASKLPDSFYIDWKPGERDANKPLLADVLMPREIVEASKDKQIESLKMIVEALKAQVAIHEKQANWQPEIIRLAEENERQKEVIDMLVKLLDVETVKGLASKEAEELRAEIATRFKKPEGA
jgi:transcriptional regulator with XRE-family HTH domain